MKMKKILASVAAAALAVSAVSANVFAADPLTVQLDDGYKGDWAQAGIITKENFDNFDGDVKVVLTVEATNVGEGQSYLLKPMEADKSWDAVTSKLTTVKESAKPDGFVMIHYDQTEVEFVVPSDMRADMWDGGISFQVSNVIIKSAVLSDGEAEQPFTEVAEGDTVAFCAASVNASSDADDGAADVDPDSADFKATLGGQLNSDFNATIGEWPADAEAYGSYTKEVTITWDFGAEKVKLAGNYLGIKTNAPFNTEEGAANAEVTVSSIKADDRDVTFDASKVFVGDNDSEAGTIKITLMNEWDSNVQGNAAVDFNAVNGEEGFSKLSVTFTIGEIPSASAETEAPATEAPATEAPATEAPATEAPVTEAPATEAPEADTTVAPAVPVADTNNTPATDKGNADTGVEGVAVVAALAVLAGGAVVIAKKRK